MLRSSAPRFPPKSFNRPLVEDYGAALVCEWIWNAKGAGRWFQVWFGKGSGRNGVRGWVDLYGWVMEYRLDECGRKSSFVRFFHILHDRDNLIYLL